MYIVVNTIIERLNSDLETDALFRVLWIDEERKYTVVMNIDDHRNMSFPTFMNYEDLVEEIEEGKCKIIELEPDLRLLSPDNDYLEKFSKKRDARWEVIKDIVTKEPEIFIPETRGKLVTEAHEISGKTRKIVRDYLKKYWFYGKTRNGLLDNYFDCGAPGKQRINENKTGPVSTNRYLLTEADIEIFNSAIKVFHKRKRMNIKTTHERMSETFYKRGFYRKYGVKVPIVDPDQCPSLRQFRYWYNKNYSPIIRYSNKHGKRRVNMDVRPLLGNSVERANCIGAMYEIDATRADVILVSFDRKSILGKPTLYVVIDVFSRLVAGFHVSLASESWFEAMIAMDNAATNKVEFCAKYGIDITEEEWPCHYLPKSLISDRGELKAQFTERFVNLEVDVLNAPSYRGDLKPFVESRFHITNETIRQFLPGSTEAKAWVRGDRDPAKEAALTIEEFNQFLIIFFMTYNKSALSRDYLPTKEMFSDNVELTPLKVWTWGKGRRLLHEKSRNEIRYNMLPREQAKVTRFGIEFGRLCYTSEIGLKEGWFEGNGVNGQKYIEISFDPRNCSSIYFKYKGELIQCVLTPKYQEFEGLHIEEARKIIEYRDNQIKLQERAEKQYRAEFHAFAENLNKSAVKETKDATKNTSYYSRQKNKREKRKEDSQIWGASNAWTSTENVSTTGQTENQSKVVSFRQNSSDEEEMNGVYADDVRALFSAKNKNRRGKNNAE
jgi:hypothetical protein